MNKLKNILLVDDNETSNFLNERLLRRMAVAESVQILSNGKQAYDFLEDLTQNPDQGVKPDLILLDVNMPVLDGFEFLELYQELPSDFRQDILVAILSTSSHPQDTQKASSYEAYYLTKPLTVEKMETLIQKHFSDK